MCAPKHTLTGHRASKHAHRTRLLTKRAQLPQDLCAVHGESAWLLVQLLHDLVTFSVTKLDLLKIVIFEEQSDKWTCKGHIRRWWWSRVKAGENKKKQGKYLLLKKESPSLNWAKRCPMWTQIMRESWLWEYISERSPRTWKRGRREVQLKTSSLRTRRAPT